MTCNIACRYARPSVDEPGWWVLTDLDGKQLHGTYPIEQAIGFVEACLTTKHRTRVRYQSGLGWTTLGRCGLSCLDPETLIRELERQAPTATVTAGPTHYLIVPVGSSHDLRTSGGAWIATFSRKEDALRFLSLPQ